MKQILKHLRENWIRHGFETLVVTIGILGAFMLNSWNEHRKNSIEEREYLERIINDLEADLVELEETVGANESVVLTASQIIEQLEGKSIGERTQWAQLFDQVKSKNRGLENFDINNFGAELIHLKTIRIFNTSETSFKELLSSGQINLITDKDLRNAIQVHYMQVFERYNFKMFPLTAREQYVKSLTKNGIGDFNQKSFEELKNDLVYSAELIATLQNYFNASCLYLFVLYYEEGSVKESTQILIDTIQDYLNRDDH